MRVLSGILLAVALLSPSISEAEPAPEITTTKLYSQLRLLCETEDAVERSQREATLHAGSERGSAAQGRAAAKLEELGSLKQRLGRMVDRYISDRQAKWHATKDVAVRIGLEDDILKANALFSGGCDD